VQDNERSPADVFVFFILACGLTWLLATPLALAWMNHTTPAPYAMLCAGLSAFGPLLAAVMVAARQKRLRHVFGRWRTNPIWIAVALFAPMAIHVLATALAFACGVKPTAWLHPPSAPERWAALIAFPIGEEFGWRGFVYPRLVARHGLVKGSLLLGAFWGVWHLMYSVTPDSGRFDVFAFANIVVQLALYSVIIAWVFERANRSMAVAIAFHAGAHLDRIDPSASSGLLLHGMHLIVVAVLAVIAARSLAKTDRLAVAVTSRMSLTVGRTPSSPP
jgi:membrane protease YdiL (CAAX protease family)